MVAMADLRQLLTNLRFANPRSLLQSGNLVFESDARNTAQLERLLEAEANKRIHLQTEFFVRTAKEWAAAVAANPFPAEAKRDPARLLIVALKDSPSANAVKALQAAITGRETIRAKGHHAYIVYPDGVGKSKLTTAVIDKHLGTRGTARNWNTTLKIAALAGSQ
jgi:uncharacterized protein (DUF1697 family)